jgi:hypothetical protein
MKKSSIILFLFASTLGFLGLAVNLYIAHGYNSQIHGPSLYEQGSQAKFVGQSGPTRTLDGPNPSFTDSAIAYFNAMTGRNVETPKTGLQKFKERQAKQSYAARLNTVEGVSQETAFWTGVTSKFGFGGGP